MNRGGLFHFGALMLLGTVFVCSLASVASGAAIPTVGIYDETATQTNNVDFNGTFSSGTGGATAANTTTASTGNGAAYSSIGPFNAALAAAFAANAGGVWNFDTQPTGNLPQANVLSYGVSQGKTITITQTGVTQFMFVTSGGPSHNSTSISLSNYLDNANGAPYAFSFSNLTGSSPGETGVVEFGFTALSATNLLDSTPINFGLVTVIANFSGGGTVTETATMNSLQGQGDTFFGFIAPAGQTVTGFSISSAGMASGTATGSPDLEDFAFITNAAVPEPSSCILLLSGVAAVLALRQVRRK